MFCTAMNFKRGMCFFYHIPYINLFVFNQIYQRIVMTCFGWKTENCMFIFVFETLGEEKMSQTATEKNYRLGMLCCVTACNIMNDLFTIS